MTEPFPGAPRDASGPGPVASVSAAALRGNAELAGLRRAPGVSPLAADGWGHGAAWVRAELADAPVERLDGATLYGLPGGHPDARPVLRLAGRVLSVKRLEAGEGVSYGYLHRAPARTRVALVTGGYAQGVVRMLGSRASVRLAGALRPIVGRVAMDVCVVDVGSLVVHAGDEVVFFGDPWAGEPSLEAWVHETGLTAAELVTAVGLRVPREAVA